MRIIDLDAISWEYNDNSDAYLPVLDSLTGDLSDVKFISTNREEYSFFIFEKLPLKKVVFDFNISFNYFDDLIHLERLESTNNIILYSSSIKADVIKCKKFESFASTIEFKELECDTTDFKLTNIVNSENNAVTSVGFIHTDNGLVLSKKKFKLNINHIQDKGLTIID